MDRGDGVATDACKAHLGNLDVLDIRQTRRGRCQEILGCEARTEFNYFTPDKKQIASSLEDTDCFCRMCCT